MVWCDILSFPSLLYNPQRTTKNHQGQSKRDTGRPRLAQSAVVPNISKGTNAETRPRVSEGKSTCLANKPGSKTQTAKGTTFDYMRSIRNRLRSSGFSQLAQSYAHPGVAVPADNMPYTSQGVRGMQTNGYSFRFTVCEGVNFLSMLFNAGLSYSAICVARSAL